MVIKRNTSSGRQVWKRSPELLSDYCAQLHRFVKLHGRDMAQLREHVVSGEHHAARAIAHNIRGIAGVIGARRMASLATELAHYLRSGNDRNGVILLADACEAEFASLAKIAQSRPPSPGSELPG